MRACFLGLAFVAMGCASEDAADLKPPRPTPRDSCDPSLSVQSDGPALLVRDPEVLSRFSLERVLEQLVHVAGADATTTPAELLQRLFDTNNSAATGAFTDGIHCDDPTGGALEPPWREACWRAEGALAGSAGLFVPGHPDYFAPVAIVNRFDLLPSNTATCGEYRVVYGKWSGRADPWDRVLLIFEGALSNPGDGLDSCRPVAQAWDALEEETDPSVIADRLEAFFFDGLPGFLPVVHPDHYGTLTNPSSMYGVTRGQVRVGLGMQEPFELREHRLVIGHQGPSTLVFEPATVKNNPLPSLFDASADSPLAASFQSEFSTNTVDALATVKVPRIRMPTQNAFNARESALDGPSATNYAAIVVAGEAAGLVDAIGKRIAAAQLGDGCPPGDPLTAIDILKRASLQTCAGCHAPHRILDEERRIGCGLVWPETPGAHVDERGRLSPALTDVFLPHRAQVMTTFLQACDGNGIQTNLEETPD